MCGTIITDPKILIFLCNWLICGIQKFWQGLPTAFYNSQMRFISKSEIENNDARKTTGIKKVAKPWSYRTVLFEYNTFERKALLLNIVLLLSYSTAHWIVAQSGNKMNFEESTLHKFISALIYSSNCFRFEFLVVSYTTITTFLAAD